MRRPLHLLTALLFATMLTGCDSGTNAPPKAGSATQPGAAAKPQRVVIGFVAKAQSNAFFDVCLAGAEAAAKELGAKHGIEVTLDVQSPPHEDAQKQSEAVDALSNRDVTGIAIACSDGNVVAPAIDRAVERGIAVVCFDSDSPRSKRLTYIGTDEELFGRSIMKELAEAMGKKGTIAVLAGNPTAPNLKVRRGGVETELASYPDMKLAENGVVFNEEVPEKAVEAMNTFQQSHPEVQGWAVIGGWPFFARDAIKWPKGQVKVVSADALPVQWPYLRDGDVEAYYSQDPYGFGYEAVNVILEKSLNNKQPESRIAKTPTRVTKETLDAFAGEWNSRLEKK
jgi:ribose transport system substrate-binding protein